MDAPLRLFFAVVASVALGAACSSSSSQPPELGDCHPTGDASCSGGTVGGGGGPGSGDGAVDSGGAEGGSSCAAAEAALSAQSPNCGPCVESSCCGSGAACEDLPGTTGCLTLVQCMIGCSGDGACQEQCSLAASGAASTAYQDYSSCLAGQCPACPTLPGLVTNDL